MINSDASVDAAGKTIGRYRVVEEYPLNPPYAHVKILFDSIDKIHFYEVNEPELSADEKELLDEIKKRLYEHISVSIEKIEDLQKYLEGKVDEIIKRYKLKVTGSQLDRILYYVVRDALGYDKIDPIMRDYMIEDISGDGWGVPVYVYHRKYYSLRSNVVFNRDEMDSFIYRLAQKSGKHVSMAKPLLDATLPNGDRLQLTLGDEITTRGSTFTIRKFRTEPITPIDLLGFGTFSPEMIAYLWLAVEHRKSILIAGGTASGKTSTLNAICMFIPPESKVVTIEDTREINLKQENWIPSVTREVEERGGQIDMYTLLKAALRQRPEFLLVGEVRGEEAYVLFQAMATGHTTYSTLHADSADAVIRRLINPPINVPFILLEGLNIILVQGIVKLGTRRVRRCRQILEVTGLDIENKKLNTNELFRWRPDDTFEFSGESKILMEIMNTLNINEEQLAEEFNNRAGIIKWMQEKKIERFGEFMKVINEYYADPDEIIEQIKADLKYKKERGSYPPEFSIP